MTGDDAQKLLDCCWGPRARRTEKAHYFVATKFAARNRGLSYAVVAIASVTGSGLFATVSKQDGRVQVALAILSVVTALIAGYQRSVQYAARSVEHQKAGADWGVIVNETEELRKQLASRGPTEAELDRIRTEMDAVTKRSPQIPEAIFAQFDIGGTYLYEDGPTVCSDQP